MVILNEFIGDVSLSFCLSRGMIMQLTVQANQKGRDENGAGASLARNGESDNERNESDQDKKGQVQVGAFVTETSIC